MEDIRLAVGVTDHPKTIRLVRKCGEGAYRCLQRLWLFARVYRPDGALAGMDADAVEIAAGWQGEIGAFYVALKEIGWLDEDGSLHDWDEHQGWSCGQKIRRQKSREAALHKWGSPSERLAKANRAERMKAAKEKGTHTEAEWETLKLLTNGLCVRCGSSATICKDHVVPVYQGGSDSIDNIQPLCKKCNASKGPEAVDHVPQEIRSLLKQTMEQTLKSAPQTKESADESAPSPIPSPSPIPNLNICSEASPSEPPVISFDCIKGEQFHVTASRVKEWAETFTAVDVLFQLRKARQWIEAHTSRRKTLRGMPKFCYTWLSKAQDESWKNGPSQPTLSTSSGFDPRLGPVVRADRG